MKILGFILIIVFSLETGKYLSEKERKKVAVCEEVCSFLEFLSEGIYNKIKIDDIISRYSANDEAILIKAKSKKELVLKFKSANYGGECEKLLMRMSVFLSELGRSSDTMAEREKCIRMLCEAREISGRCAQEHGKKNELYKKLGLICGIMLCIVLV